VIHFILLLFHLYFVFITLVFCCYFTVISLLFHLLSLLSLSLLSLLSLFALFLFLTYWAGNKEKQKTRYTEEFVQNKSLWSTYISYFSLLYPLSPLLSLPPTLITYWNNTRKDSKRKRSLKRIPTVTIGNGFPELDGDEPDDWGNSSKKWSLKRMVC
jgi:hypothetical protein